MKCDQKSCVGCPSAAQKRSKEDLIACRLSRIRNKVLVMSGKGGVGKSSIASYLALALAKKRIPGRTSGHRPARAFYSKDVRPARAS